MHLLVHIYFYVQGVSNKQNCLGSCIFIEYQQSRHLHSLLYIDPSQFCLHAISREGGGGGGGNSNIKKVGMLVVSHRGVNFRFWSRLGCSEKITNIFSLQGLA